MAKGVNLRPEDAAVIGAAAKRVKNTPRSLVGDRKAPASIPGGNLNCFVPIINKTGAELEAFSVVRIDRTVVKENRGVEENFPFRNYAWNATAPNASLSGLYGVTQGLALVNGTVQAMVAGVTKVHLDDYEEGQYAKPIDGDTTKMETADEGPYLVLGVEEAGAADTWGYVSLTSAGPSSGGLALEVTIQVVDQSSGLAWVSSGSGVFLARAGYHTHLRAGRTALAIPVSNGTPPWWLFRPIQGLDYALTGTIDPNQITPLRDATASNGVITL